MIPKINSSHGSETRNLINRAIDYINTHEKMIRGLASKDEMNYFSSRINELLGGRIKKIHSVAYRPESPSYAQNYFYFREKLVAGERYAIEFIPNTDFYQDKIEIGTDAAAAHMVDILAADTNFIAGRPFWVENYMARVEDLGEIRIFDNAWYIEAVNIYSYDHTGGRIDVNESDVKKIESLVGSLDSQLKHIESDLLGGEIKVPFGNETYRPDEGSQFRPNYFYMRQPRLSQGVAYALEFKPTQTFTQEKIEIGTNTGDANMVDVIAENVEFVAGETYWIEKYVPTADDVGFFRLTGNALNIAELNVYTYENTGGRIKALEDAIASGGGGNPQMINELNQKKTELRRAQNTAIADLESLLTLVSTAGTEKTVTIPSVGEREKYILRVGLHYGSERFTPSENEIFLDGQSEQDFSDVRFFDNNGKILKAQFGPAVNMEVLEDDNLADFLHLTSDGTIVGFAEGQGITLSHDAGQTYEPIPNTANVTANASDPYGRVDMYPVWVDRNDNIYAYAGGIMYKLYASDGYATIKNVVDYSWQHPDGHRIYPDIQDQGMDESSNGTLYFGLYQAERYTAVYRSIDGGESFESSFNSGFGTDYQHVHHIHADPYSNKVYVGVDDGGTTQLGARILVTENNGSTWTDITEDTFVGIRGRDFYPTYFGEDYNLGGGESYYNGGGVVYKAGKDDKNMEVKYKGIAGIRSYNDFGDDSLIVAGTNHVTGGSTNQILISEDQGETWTPIYTKQQPFINSSGGGFRRGYSDVLFKGETEPCVVFSHRFGFVKPMRIYKGGDHYYREAFIELENVPDAPIELTVKTGYAVEYPYKNLNGREHDGLVYHVPLNEGRGTRITDSLGNAAQIEGAGFDWETEEEPVRYGDYGESPQPLFPSSALKLEQGTTINFGKVPALNFNRNYTVTFWINNKARWASAQGFSMAWREMLGLFSAGDIKFFAQQRYFGYGERDITYNNRNNKGYTMMESPPNGWGYSDQYFFVAIVVGDDYKVQTYVNGGNTRSSYEENRLFSPLNLSNGDFVIGDKLLESAGYISDIKVYNSPMEQEEIMELYKGW